MDWTLVTGSARGLGAAICLELAKKKYPLIIHYNKSYNDAIELQKKCLKYGCNAEIIQGDFSTKKSLLDFSHKLTSSFKLKNLINNVGNYFLKSTLETNYDDWLTLFQINLHAPFFLSKVLSQSVIEKKGSIINIGVAGLQNFKGNTYSSAYTLTKNSLLGLTKSLAKELAPFDVTVNMVSPGYLENSIELPENLNSLPTGKLISLLEVVDLIVFLLGDKSRHITGQNIEISGGVGL